MNHLDELSEKRMVSHKRSQIAKATLKNKSKAGDITIVDFELYYKAVVVKSVWHWHKNRHKDQWNSIENAEMSPQPYGQLILDKAEMNAHWENECLSNKWCWDNWTVTCKTTKLDHFLTPYTSINSRWVKDLTVRPENIEILGEYTGNNFFDIGCSNFFLNMSPEAEETEQK